MPGGTPEWKETTGRLDERVIGTNKRLENLEDEVKSISFRMWGALVGVILLLVERVLNQVDTGTPEVAAFTLAQFLSALPF